MEAEDKKERSEDELRKELEEAKEEIKAGDIPKTAEERPTSGPNAFWNQKGTWWILIIVFALVLFLFLWMFLAPASKLP